MVSLFYPYQLIINPFTDAARVQCYLRPGHLPHQIAQKQQRPPKPRHRSRAAPRHPLSTQSRTAHHPNHLQQHRRPDPKTITVLPRPRHRTQDRHRQAAVPHTKRQKKSAASIRELR